MSKIVKIIFPIMVIFLFGVEEMNSQSFVPNCDEFLVPNYHLPDPLILSNGKRITNKEVWEIKRRSEIIGSFKKYVYGRTPGKKVNIEFIIVSVDSIALNGKAIRKEVIIRISGNEKKVELNLLVYLPNNGSKKHPVFLGLNFYGNHTINNDAGITISKNWIRNNDSLGVVDNRATEKSRGVRSHRWNVEYILEQGYGISTMYYGDIDPDYNDGFQNGIHPLFYKEGQIKPADDEWASIAAWSWGLSRAVDYLVTDEMIDKGKIILMGHSRLGKAALWAGALDKRFAIVISNNSGCGGAALFRRSFGETIEKINTDFPHWFCENFKEFNNNEEKLSVDQHMLISLIAPRPVYIASAEDDLWADPRGEFLSAKYAGVVYNLYGLQGLEVDDLPNVNAPVMNHIGYHVREGKHDVTLYDWKNFIEFANKHYGISRRE